MDAELQRGIWLGVATLAGSFLACRFAKKTAEKRAIASSSDVGIGNSNGNNQESNFTSAEVVMREVRVHILYGTTTGTAKGFAHSLQQYLLRTTSLLQKSTEAVRYIFDICDIADYDEDSLESEDVVVFLLSTWEGGKCPEPCSVFFDWLHDYAYDFRVSKAYLQRIRFSVFGLGGELYGANYCKAAKDLDENLAILGGKRLLKLFVGDDASNLEDSFQQWRDHLACSIFEIPETSTLKAMQKQQTLDLQMANQRLAEKSRDGDDTSVASTSTAGVSRRQQKKMVRKELYTARKQQMKAAKASGMASTEGSGNRKVAIVGGTGTSVHHTLEARSLSTVTRNDAESASLTTAPEEDEEEEEDRINNRFITMDLLDESASSAPMLKSEGAGEEAAELANQLAAIYRTSSGSAKNSPSRPTRKKSSSKVKNSTGSKNGSKGVMDLEDIGSSMAAASDEQRRDLTVSLKQSDVDMVKNNELADNRREMATKLQKKALTKEGYKLIGSHSAVKLCRWTKHQLRGRGGCYKHTFYGITSYQCMEATPSLACANKCVFCWRHHKNPVGTEWRWKEDPPEFIVEEAVTLHRKMINEARGMPGVKPERLAEAFNVRHCALSLVGEPIMYPRINEMLTELHNREISTFLVTNAQFPEQIRTLQPITQLYVSVDASTRDSLKAVDRPLFSDFWDRFLDSLVALKEKRQRTVYRMTLVKDWNMAEAEGYAELIELGQPDLIEIKSVTYCGKSDASSLTMEHVPWHHETCAYAEALSARLQQRGMLPYRYEIATEHQHSCCILLARVDKYKIDGVWHTWIDYPKFHALMRRYYESNGKETFVSTDYLAPTPAWALYQSPEHGFDPEDERYYRNKTTKKLEEIPYEPSESGCG